MDPIQPWSAAGAEKPILIFSPEAGAALPVAPDAPLPAAWLPAASLPAGALLAASVAAAGELLLVALFEELVQAVRASAPAAMIATVRNAVREERDMVCSFTSS